MQATNYRNQVRNPRAAGERFDRENPGLREELLRVCTEVNDNFYQSLERSLFQYGSLTERQTAALKRSLAARLDRLEQRAAARPAPARPIPNTNDRIVITGTVVSTKWVENDFGGALKMLVQHEHGWRCYGTVPRALDGAEKGDVVRFVASLQRKEDDFGFFSRPAQAMFVRRAIDAEPEPEAEPQPDWDAASRASGGLSDEYRPEEREQFTVPDKPVRPFLANLARKA